MQQSGLNNQRHGLNPYLMINDGSYGSNASSARRAADDGSVFAAQISRPSRAASARRKTFKSLTDLPSFCRVREERGAGWDFPVSDKVLSPTIRKAHPQGNTRRLNAHACFYRCAARAGLRLCASASFGVRAAAPSAELSAKPYHHSPIRQAPGELLPRAVAAGLTELLGP